LTAPVEIPAPWLAPVAAHLQEVGKPNRGAWAWVDAGARLAAILEDGSGPVVTSRLPSGLDMVQRL
jgi:hypothetical protein